MMTHTRNFRGKVQSRAEEIAAEFGEAAALDFFRDFHRAADRLQELSSRQMADRTVLPPYIGLLRVVCENTVMIKWYQQDGRWYLVDSV